MATTTFYPTSTASTATLPAAFSGTKKLLSLTRGGGVVSQADATIASLGSTGSISNNQQSWGAATAAILPKNGLVFVTNALDAVSLGSVGNFGWNLRAAESATAANYGIGFHLYQISADGSTATLIDSAGNTTELGTGEAAWVSNNAYIGGSTITIASHERIALVLVWGASGGVSASGRTATGWYNGTAAAASGDTWVTFAETVTEAKNSPPFQSRTNRNLLLRR